MNFLSSKVNLVSVSLIVASSFLFVTFKQVFLHISIVSKLLPFPSQPFWETIKNLNLRLEIRTKYYHYN